MSRESFPPLVASFRPTLSQILKQNWKTTVTLILLVGLVSATIAWFSRRIQNQIQINLASSLTTVLDTVHAAILVWEEDRQRDVSLLTQSSEIRSALSDPANASARIRRAIAPAMRIYGFVDFVLMDLAGRPLAAAQDSDFGLVDVIREKPDLVGQARHGRFSVKLMRGANAPADVFMAAPIRDDNDQILAILVLQLNPKKELDSVAHLGRMRQTGETYLFDEGGHLLTESRFEHQPPAGSPRARASYLVAQEVSKSKAGINLKGYPDYRGIPVVGAWQWDDRLSIGIVSEMDVAEAVAPARAVSQLGVLTIIIITSVLLAILAILANRARIIASNIAYDHALRARQNILAIVSHDLKNPLNTILLACKMLEMDTTQKGADIIRRAAQSMSQLITDLLDTAKLEAGQLRMDLQACEVQPIIAEALELMSPLAAGKGVTISCDIAPAVPAFTADPKRVVQVLSNLIGNAIKFTAAGGIIKVSVRAGTSSDVEFAVSDTGPGIAVEDQPHIFDQYWQASRTRGHGVGLGLYICKSIVTASRGQIHVQSVIGQGATFVFTLPRARPS